MRKAQVVCRILALMTLAAASPLVAQSASSRPSEYETIAARAKLKGDPNRGALLFFRSAACATCHASGSEASPLGPDLTTIDKHATDASIVESILSPSSVIREGYQTLNVLTVDGEIRSGLKVKQTEKALVLRAAKDLQTEIEIPLEEIEEIVASKKSMMPDDLAGNLLDPRDLIDLVRYVIEVARGGPQRAEELRPDPADLIVRDDTIGLNHAAILQSLNEKDFNAGRNIYKGHCQNCHGADGNTPTLPTARAFGTEPMKFGDDPYKMLLTLTRGAGLMAQVQHLAPKERYQVIHYIREALMKPSNPAYREIDDAYLSQLPAGTRLDDETQTGDRDFGPALGSQIGKLVNNALTMRLSDDFTTAYDLHRMRSAGVWTGGFLDLSETHHYRQRGEQMPQIDGELVPGLSEWGWFFGDTFDIPAGAKPPRGPLETRLLDFKGYYLHDDRVVLSYQIHSQPILETVHAATMNEHTLLQNTFHLEPSDQPLKLSVAQLKRDRGPSGSVDLQQQVLSSSSGPAEKNIVFVTGEDERLPVRPQMENRPRHLIDGNRAVELDLGTPGRTILIRFRTTQNGTLVASSPHHGRWQPDGKSVFIRGNRLVFDIGWVGAMTGRSNVADGQWHVAAIVVNPQHTSLYVDGKLEAKQNGFRRDAVQGHVFKIGATASDFGGDFQGDIDWVRIEDTAFSGDQIERVIRQPESLPGDPLLTWQSPSRDANPNEPLPTATSPARHMAMVAAAVSGDLEGVRWNIDESGRITISIAPSPRGRTIAVHRCAASMDEFESVCQTLRTAAAAAPAIDPAEMTRGGSLRWPEVLTVQGKRGEPINGYALDTIPVPFENPWNVWMRTSALDFFSDGRAVVTTHGGDVFIVSGLDDQLENVQWKRFAAGLFEPFGVRVIDETIYVTCHDGIKRLHDLNGNGEADYVEAFWNDDDVSSVFHAYNFDLQTDTDGNLYIAKAGQHTDHGRPGAIMRIPSEGGRAEAHAWGVRTPNGMGRLPDDRITVSDNQGPWMPAGKISFANPGSFLGNMPINDEQTAWLKQRSGGELPTTFEQPFIWLPQELDNSCGGQLWVDDKRFGPLAGHLMHSSFGKGWLYYLSLQETSEATQASIVALPHQWDAGVMRLRTNPADGQIYGTGLSGWQGPAGGKDGCFQRLRYTGKPAKLITQTRVIPGGIELRFSFSVDEKTASDPQSWKIEAWNYLWSKRYGSDQFSVNNPNEKGRDSLTVDKVIRVDEQTLRLMIPDLTESDQVSVEMNFREADGSRFVEHVYFTINDMP